MDKLATVIPVPRLINIALFAKIQIQELKI